MTKQDIINYVVETPTNTNKAILSDMLDEFVSESDSDDSFIYKATVSLNVTVPGNYNSYSIEMYSFDSQNYTAFMLTEDNEILIDSQTVNVRNSDGTPVVVEMFVMNDNYFYISNLQHQEMTVTGDAEQVYDDNLGGYVVKVYGDCSISSNGTYR